jgi:hypothetical protein
LSIVVMCLATACSPRRGAQTADERTAATGASTAQPSDSLTALGTADAASASDSLSGTAAPSASTPGKLAAQKPASVAKKPAPAAEKAAGAAEKPAAAPAATALAPADDWVDYDAATNTVTFKLEAGPFSFDGFTNGGATLTVPPKSTVVMNFLQNDGTPHSAEVVSGEGPLPNSGGDPAIPRAFTNKVVEGLPQGAKDVIRFQAPEAGTYRIGCGVPGHALSGMWLWFKIDPAAKAPTFGATK